MVLPWTCFVEYVYIATDYAYYNMYNNIDTYFIYVGSGALPFITYDWIDDLLWMNIVMHFIWWFLIILCCDFHDRAGDYFKHFAYMKEP